MNLYIDTNGMGAKIFHEHLEPFLFRVVFDPLPINQRDN
uniref:Uncharacterized protein n=1 Tax=Rhizophora mucronata TaxID=61149 RepID=A0A2P2R1Y1_RHIMU